MVQEIALCIELGDPPGQCPQQRFELSRPLIVPGFFRHGNACKLGIVARFGKSAVALIDEFSTREGSPIDADILRTPVGPGSLHVERSGHGGPPVLLVHGFGTSSFVWRAVAPTLAENGMTAYAVDLLGYGESDRPRDADVGIAAQAEYLDRLMTALRTPKATVVGVDLGGSVALRLAAVHPDRVARLILVSPLAFDALPGVDIRAMQRSTARYALRLTRGVFGAAPLLEPLLRGAVSDQVHMPPRLVGRYLAPYVGREGVEQLLVLARSIRVDDLADVDLAEVRAPTLVVWGDADRSMTAELPERLSRAIPNCRALRVPGAGRLIPEETPLALARVIVDFVGALRGGSERPDPAQTV